VGSPATSYGTAEKSAKLGRAISAQHALALDNAVFAGDEPGIRQVLADAGIGMTVAEAVKLVDETSVMPVAAACDAIAESVSQARKLGIPTLVHAEPTTKNPLLLAAKELGARLIAVHVNHTFSVDESLRVARALKDAGSAVEVITADIFGAKQIEAAPDVTFALLKEGLVDVVTTDFSGGYHDPILLLLQKAVEAGVTTLARAVQLATSAPARIIPRVAPCRGFVEPGKIADLCIVDRDDLSKVRTVIIGGRVVVQEGRLIRGQHSI
jgi:imidazolonepropionase-like amidohydrolase